MRTFTSATTLEQPTPSNRRQPARQARTNPARAATNALPSGDALAQAPDVAEDAMPGFFPAITHFADAITALPKEMVRHYTMLKEVDAKIYGPEDVLGQLLNTALKAPLPPRSINGGTKIGPSQSQTNTQESSHQPDLARRTTFASMRAVMAEMLMTLDEKNHVMNEAIDTLNKQLKRCQSSYPYIEDEISEEARYGSLTHWAYSTDKTAEKKGLVASERTRRTANNLAAAHEAEVVAMRSEARRDAVAARKQHRNPQVDSDFDDGRVLGKRAQAGAKGRKTADSTFVGLGIANVAAPPNKRRKVEKPALGGFAMDRAMSSVYGSNTGTGRGRAASPKDVPSTYGIGKKKGRGGGAVGVNARKRGNTGTSAVNSPSMASSPVVGTFAAAKDRQGRSPAPAILQRVPSSRARQNSTQSIVQLSRNRSSSTNHRGANGNGLHGSNVDVEKVSGLIGKSLADVKSSMKEVVNAKGEHLVEEIAGGDGANDMKGALVVGSKANDRGPKREEADNGNSRTRAERPPSISVSTRGGGNSRQPSKNATPLTATFPEPQRPRLPRNADQPQKRSHKKGAGAAAQLAAAKAHHDDGSSIHGDEEEDEKKNEPRYCYCQEVSYGEMVGCDNDDCPREWFHLGCVGLTKPPPRSAQWYCDECKESLKKNKFNGGNGR